MQWTNESDAPYGADPYGADPYRGAGYGYGYGYGDEYGGSTVDTAPAASGPVEWAHAAQPAGYADTAGPNPSTAWPHLYVLTPDAPAAEPGPDTAGWDTGPGDVLTVPPPPDNDTPDLPAPGPDTAKDDSTRPVFVDSSGRRQRRVLRAARLLVIPAGGYVALLISTVLGGPTLNAPFVPQQDSTHPRTPPATTPDTPAGAGHTAGSATSAAQQANSRPTPTQKTSGSADRPATSAATPEPTTSTPAALESSSSAPTAAPIPTRTSKGRAIGSSHKPVK
ncbi:hypothetical protein ACIRH0_37795 [Streptomyces sp. NPDC093675]|uniref:hypothetical protein n=1 Tax=Streptomyces sp. NPDC093675 TaxID=3366049 RepID=UPI0038121FB8